MNNGAAVEDIVGMVRNNLRVNVSTAGGLHNLAKSLLHIFGHLDFVVTPLPVKAQNRDAPLIHDIGVKLAETVFVGDHLAASVESDGCAVHAPALLLQRGPISFGSFTDIVKVADHGHLAAAAKFNVIAAQEVILAVELPPGHVKMHASGAVMIVGRNFFHLRKVAGAIAAHRIGQVTADGSRRIGQTIGEERRARVQQQAGGFAGTGADHKRFGIDLLLGARGFVHVGDGLGLSVFADNNFTSHGASDEGQAPGGLRGRNHHLAGTEVGSGDASPTALPAIVARGAPVDRFGDNGEARGNAKNIEMVASLLDDGFTAARRGRWQEYAVRGTGDIFFAAEDSDVGLNFVVIGSQVFVGDGPVIAHAIVGAAFEIYRSEAQSDAAPVIGAASHDTRTKPAETRTRSRGVGFALDLPESVGRQELAVEIVLLSAHADTAVRQLVGPDMLFVIFLRIERRAGFQQHHIQAALSENFGGRATGGARSNNTNVIDLGGTDDLGHEILKAQFLQVLAAEPRTFHGIRRLVVLDVVVLDSRLFRVGKNPLPVNHAVTDLSHVRDHFVAVEVAAVDDTGIGNFLEVFHMHQRKAARILCEIMQRIAMTDVGPA